MICWSISLHVVLCPRLDWVKSRMPVPAIGRNEMSSIQLSFAEESIGQLKR